MRFHADLHIHSKYSRATSRDLDLEHLSAWAGRKGVALVGTGDFTHPAWRAELKEKLVPAEAGLFRLRPEIEREVAQGLPAACRSATRFMLTVEISTIYKKGDRTRKIHHLLYAPDFDTADRISASLARIGNIASDGRPILGLDSRNLLEITLQSSPDAYLVPAHIWTPWFAALGAQSGFDSIVECYGDLAGHIFAVETGLSSDPAMNWRLSMLDRYRLVSNSDAHSPGKVGREATIFDTELDYFAIRRALETGEGYVGTVEFFPEEGKYHLDGHRKCAMRLTPEESRAHGNRCPSCGQPITIGVLHRVDALADRSEAEAAPPPTAGEVTSLVALPEILSELVASGPASKAVERDYNRLLATLGAELSILDAVPVEDITRSASSLLGEAIVRLRAGQVIREAGYDGEYGTIRLFEEAELRRLTSGGSLFDPDRGKRQGTARGEVAPKLGQRKGAERRRAEAPAPLLALDAEPAETLAAMRILAPLDEDQRRAVETVDGPLVIVAGPGSGKTRTLTHRIAHLVAERGVPAAACLAITFTRRAAAEMQERLAHLLPGAPPVAVHTFHSLGLSMLREHAAAAGLRPDFRVASEAERRALLVDVLAVPASRADGVLREISRIKRNPARLRASRFGEAAPASDLTPAGELARYQQALTARNLVDFDDLVGLAARMIETDAAVAAHYRQRFPWIAVDEFQDVDEQQYRWLTLLVPPAAAASETSAASAPWRASLPAGSSSCVAQAFRPAIPASPNLCVIGDPDQAIYGFRGADAACFAHFMRDYPEAATVRLARNYRSSGTIVTASAQVIAATDRSADDEAARTAAAVVREMYAGVPNTRTVCVGVDERITIHAAATERAEAEFVVHTIEQMLGGHSLFSLDSRRATGTAAGALGFADFAVLYRTGAQAEALGEAFARSGLPFATHSHEPLLEQPAVRALAEAWARGARTPDERSLAAALNAAAADLAGCDLTHDAAARDAARARLLAVAEACEGDAARFADALAVATEVDFRDPRAECISLLTLHASKGLEFPIVFIVGLEDGVLPLSWGPRDAASAAEERRLFYVGMTRAKDRLFLSHARQRAWRGAVRPMTPSPFLQDIERALVTEHRAEARKPEARQLKLL